MPELPEVETVARSLRRHLVGRTVAAVETSGLALRRPVDARTLAGACVGARVEAVDRFGKYLLVRFSGGRVLLAHLGMSGRFLFARAADAAARPPHTHAVFVLERGDELRYVDARRFGVLATYADDEVWRSPELGALGPDPLSDAFTAARLAAALAESRRDVKQFLLDQGRVAGLGNIYVAEALFEAGISPRRRADRLGAARAARLHAAIRSVLLRSVERRGTTFRDYVDADGAGGGNQHHLHVYGREGEPCRACAAPVRRLVQGARSTFYCPRCQR
jgi:formamidopyrimidine-DNA glycosylase